MKKYFDFFIRRTALFFLPIMLLLAFPAWVLFVSGELVSVDSVIQKQQKIEQPLLLGLAYSNPIKYFKLNSLIARRPKIVVFGNSHIMSFRQSAFGKPFFYNASVGGSRLPDFESFVSHIPLGMEPKVLVVGLDPFFALPDFDWSQKAEERFDRRAGWLDAIRIMATSWKSVYQDYFKHKYTISDLVRPHQKWPALGIGMDAIVNGNGFGNDGSYFQPKKTSAYTAGAADYSRLKSGESFNQRGVAILEDFLDTCKRRHIHAIGILPPMRHAVNAQLRSTDYRYLDDLPDRLAPLFKSTGFSFYDFSEPSYYGGNDNEFYDDFHPSEDAYQRIAAILMSSEPTLSL